MTKLDEGYKSTLGAIKIFHSEVEETILQTEKVLSRLDLKESSEISKYETERQKLLKLERVLKKEVEKHTQNLLTELDQRRDLLMKSVQDGKNRSEKIKKKKDLENRKESLSNSLSQNNASQVFNIFKQEKTLTVDRKQKVEQENTKCKGLPQYVPGKQPIFETQHGELIELKDENKQDKFQVLQQFNTKQPIVQNLVCRDDGTLWTSHFYSKKIQKIQLNKGSVPVQVIKKLKAIAFYMVLLPTGDLLMSLKEDALQILSNANGEMKRSIYTFSPLQTLAVDVTKANRIIVGVREKSGPFPVIGPRQVIVMDINGRKEKVYHLGDKMQSIFTAAARKTSDKDNNIVVLDRINEEFDGRIVALNETNGLRWVYSDHQHINKQQKFEPTDIVATESDNFIVTDCDDQMIHFLNNSGQCNPYLNTKYQLGIELPYSVDIDNAGTLYIGCSIYTKANLMRPKYKLFQVSGF